MKRLILGLTAALSGAALVAASSTTPQPVDPRAGPDPPARSTYVETVEVSLVVMHVTVLDKRHQAVIGLRPQDFTITEDGVPQAISAFGSSMDQPVKMAFLLDVSGSMGVLGKLARASDAVRLMIATLGGRDEVGLLAFSDGQVRVAQDFTTDRGRIEAALSGLRARGQTALRNALAEAPDLLSTSTPGRKGLVILTDGLDNASTVSTVEAIQTARRAAVPIFVVGLHDFPPELRVQGEAAGETGAGFETLMEFTRGTGGEFYPVFAPEEMRGAVDGMLERLRGQYILGYRPGPGSSRPGFHRVEVATVDGRFQVLGRRGYVTRSALAPAGEADGRTDESDGSRRPGVSR